jgi:proline dehydrogenase
MPGEKLDDALAAAQTLGQHRIATIVTQLGEHIRDRAEAEGTVAHYLEVARRIATAGLDTEISIKLTQLGQDIDRPLSIENARRIVEAGRVAGIRVWLDMENTPYVDPTLEAFRSLRATHENVGVALQAYLRRTADDLESLLPLGPAVRVVKGAYREAPELVFPRKQDVDENFFRLCERLLDPAAGRPGTWLAAGTHDLHLIHRIVERAKQRSAEDAFEIAMLYGIQREEQRRLAAAGVRTRVLISYGSHWFPWYMRRLAERPANLLFVMRNALGG